MALAANITLANLQEATQKLTEPETNGQDLAWEMMISLRISSSMIGPNDDSSETDCTVCAVYKYS